MRAAQAQVTRSRAVEWKESQIVFFIELVQAYFRCPKIAARRHAAGAYEQGEQGPLKAD